MANSLALLVQQREMTAAEIADERKAAEALQHSPLVAKYLPGQPIGPPNKHAWNDKALKTVKAWEHKQAAKIAGARNCRRSPSPKTSRDICGPAGGRMTEHFQHVRGGFTLYLGGDHGDISDCRFVLGHFGEDADKIIKAFWQERRGDFVVVPLFCYGAPPRRELCTQQSLAAAVKTLTIEPGGMVEKKWKEVCLHLNVAWPSRLSPKAA